MTLILFLPKKTVGTPSAPSPVAITPAPNSGLVLTPHVPTSL